MKKNTFLPALLFSCLLVACGEPVEIAEPPPVRGMKGYVVSRAANFELRRYPSIVQPARETKLSFEVGGKLKSLDLEVGQRVEPGQILAEIDPVSLQLNLQQAQASLQEARAALSTAKADYQRKQDLLARKFVTQSQYEQAENQYNAATAQLQRAEKSLELARESLKKTRLQAPFKGVISSVESRDFAQVAAGEVVLGMYSEGAYEVSFSVPASIINKIAVGDRASITFPDLGTTVYQGHLKELGARATSISSFPVVVALDETPAALKAGLSAEVTLEIPLDIRSDGFLIPVSGINLDSSPPTDGHPNLSAQIGSGTVFVYDSASSTVQRRTISIIGVYDQMLIVGEGLHEGEIIAAAGISYLRDGQQVKLLPMAKQ
ncbi:efflux RND transporter periplasmic adaptor subunit [Pseudomaricurvus alcaniphilus]|uniref:efflux RND transporter periplasmic adaptor subunit n=1 Tax=Pseudomaricurvus alcaniphilus TaxID=1166482 RepID=UPI00140C944A|nr:efflux RND transporter periplasmic adaptor subunit [Pseudomaricurvus alcaniphilus]NHN36947.1 efflux RND transporter periplasmic adaptor subunit [Pseudomaricurvus alcaniphilus]